MNKKEIETIIDTIEAIKNISVKMLKQRALPNSELLNSTLLVKFINHMNSLSDDDFVKVLHGNPAININLKVAEQTCMFGNLENIPCQWLYNEGKPKCNPLTCEGYKSTSTSSGKEVKLNNLSFSKKLPSPVTHENLKNIWTFCNDCENLRILDCKYDNTLLYFCLLLSWKPEWFDTIPMLDLKLHNENKEIKMKINLIPKNCPKKVEREIIKFVDTFEMQTKS